ncbi:hypothetical protein RRG08_066876, partial [Elysia crispata]
MLRSVVFYFCLVLVELNLGNASRRYCPPKFSRQGSYCFTLSDKTYMIKFGFEHDLCSKIGGKTFEVTTWEDQRAAERFLKERGVIEKVWLRGYILRMEFRHTTNSFVWATDFHPKVYNFVSPDTVTMASGKWSRGSCVVMDPQRDYKWDKAICDKERHQALCYM